MAKVNIEVQDSSYGYDITVENVTISKDQTTNKVAYYVDGVYFDQPPEIEDRKTRDFFQVAYLVYRQKNEEDRREIDKLIDEILKM